MLSKGLLLGRIRDSEFCLSRSKCREDVKEVAGKLQLFDSLFVPIGSTRKRRKKGTAEAAELALCCFLPHSSGIRGEPRTSSPLWSISPSVAGSN